MEKVGLLLSKMSDFKFPAAGFFDADLQVVESAVKSDYVAFAKACLASPHVLAQLGPNMIAQIDVYLAQYVHLFPDEGEKHLVHADFDPANILIDRVSGTWEVTGILDWEFSFSGSILWDVANMLRYAHQMPPVFETSFLHGLKSGGISLPEHWRASVALLNLTALLDCLERADPEKSPKQCADIYDLINHFLCQLN